MHPLKVGPHALGASVPHLPPLRRPASLRGQEGHPGVAHQGRKATWVSHTSRLLAIDRWWAGKLLCPRTRVCLCSHREEGTCRSHNLPHAIRETSQTSHPHTQGRRRRRRRRRLLPLPLAELTRPLFPFESAAGWAAGCCRILNSTLQSCLRTDNSTASLSYSPFCPQKYAFLKRNGPCLGFANSKHPSCFALERPRVTG